MRNSIIEVLIVKVKKEVYERFKKNVDLDSLQDDVLWAAQDMLIDETSIDNYIQAVSELDCFTAKVIFNVDLLPTIVKDQPTTPENIKAATEALKEEYNPKNEWDDIKFLNVRHDAEWEVTQYLRDNGFSVDILFL